jgi:hypothetical protein
MNKARAHHPHHDGRPRVTSEILDRMPPADLDAERTLLGYLIVGDRRDDVRQLVCPADLYDVRHREILEHLDAMPADIVGDDGARIQWLGRAAGRDDHGAYLVEIVHQAAATVRSAAYAAEQVAVLAKRRRAAEAAIFVVQTAHDPDVDIEQLRAQLAELLASLDTGKDANTQTSGVGKPRLVTMDTVQPEPITWLWPGRVPIGKLTLFAGDPGRGKSLLTIDMAARLSRGSAWPDTPEHSPVGSTIFVSAEDDPADTIRPRLDAAGADCSRVAILEAVECGGPDPSKPSARTFSLERDMLALEAAVGQMAECRLVVIDPISAYCGATDSHRNTDVRGLLAPLAELAQRLRVAIVCVTHLNKSAGPAMYRSMGSLAFVAAARAVWAVTDDPNDKNTRLVLPVKCNLAPDLTGLSYRVVTADNGAPCVAWSDAPVTMTIDDALDANRDEDRRGGERREAKEWLQQVLGDGPMPATDIKQLARQEGPAWGTVRRAKEELGINVFRDGFGAGSVSKWALPDPPELPPESRRCAPGSIDAHKKEVSTYGTSEHLCRGADAEATESRGAVA